MVQQRQEISVPQPVFWGVTHAASCAGNPWKDVAQSLGGDDLEVEAQEGLNEAVFNSLAVVDARVRLR